MNGSKALLLALAKKAGVKLNATSRSEMWNSADLSGERIVLDILLSGPNAANDAARLLLGIGECEIALPSGFVADIYAGPIVSYDSGVRLALEALLLD